MNIITKTIFTLMAAVATTSPAMAESRQSDYGDHMTLGNTIRSTGIQLKLNTSKCWERGAMGWYYAYGNEMVICQQNKRSVGVEAQWTEEDLDTLRHEAQHLIQDCMDGARQGRLSSVYKNPIGFVKSTLSERGIRHIINAYSDAGDHIILMELEAFAVAALNQPLVQSQDINQYCL